MRRAALWLMMWTADRCDCAAAWLQRVADRIDRHIERLT